MFYARAHQAAPNFLPISWLGIFLANAGRVHFSPLVWNNIDSTMLHLWTAKNVPCPQNMFHVPSLGYVLWSTRSVLWMEEHVLRIKEHVLSSPIMVYGLITELVKYWIKQGLSILIKRLRFGMVLFFREAGKVHVHPLVWANTDSTVPHLWAA